MAHLIFLVLTSGSALAQQPYRPTSFDLVLLFYKQSGLPIPWQDLAQNFDDYRRVRNEFDRRELLAQLRPVMERDLQAVAAHELFVFPTIISIGQYDFGRGVFPLSITPLLFSEFSTQVPGPRPAILFLNADKFMAWPMPEGEARGLLETLRGARSLAADIEYRPVRAREGSLNWNSYRIIDVEIVRIRLSTADRRVPIGVLVP